MPLGATRFGFSGGLVPLEAEWFAAAGGGGAGGNGIRNSISKPGGGGGAGGLLSNNDSGLSLATWNLGQTYTMTIGAGGSGGQGYDQTGDFGIYGSRGSDTTWNDATNGTLTLNGGGAGGGEINVGSAVQDGGSGGGGSGDARTSGEQGFAYANTPSQGNDGDYGTNYFESGAGGGKGGAGGGGTHGSMTAGAGFTWSVDSITYSQGGRGADRQNSQVGTGPTTASANTGNGGPSRYNDYYAGLGGGSGVIGIKFPDVYTLSNPGGGLTISQSSTGGYTIAYITAGTGNIQFN